MIISVRNYRGVCPLVLMCVACRVRQAAIRALSLISGALVSGRGAALAAHEARLLDAVAEQLRRLRSSPSAPSTDALPAYKYLASALTTVRTSTYIARLIPPRPLLSSGLGSVVCYLSQI